MSKIDEVRLTEIAKFLLHYDESRSKMQTELLVKDIEQIKQALKLQELVIKENILDLDAEQLESLVKDSEE